MKRIAKSFLPIVLLCLAAWPGALIAATDYPKRAITMIVPYAAGGVTDLGARAVAESMEKHLKQPVLVVNKVGGATTIGGYAVASSKPDGYTLGFFPSSGAIPEAYAIMQEAPYSSKDLRTICCVVGSAYTITVREDAPWKSLKELIEYARMKPGMKAGTGSKLTRQYMFLTMLNRTEKTGFVCVPFGGDPQNMSALLGGHTSVGMIDFSSVKSLADAKKVRVLAVLTEKRVDFAPEVPTVAELGYPMGYLSTAALGIVGPKGIPDEIVHKIDSLVANICNEPEFKTKIRNVTLQINYQDAATYQETLDKYKEAILTFIKEEGVVK